MPDAPRKYFLITDEQLQAARKIWPQVNLRTYVLVLKRGDEPMVLSKAPQRGVGIATVNGMYYRREMDVLILISGETPLVK